MESTDGQSWSNYIGPKRDNPQVCLTRPVFTPFPLKVAWSGISLITIVLAMLAQTSPVMYEEKDAFSGGLAGLLQAILKVLQI